MQENKIPVQVIRLSVIALVIIAIIVFKTITSNMAEAKIDKLLEDIPAGTITYEDTSVDLIGLEVHIEDVTLNVPNGKDIKIDEIVINDIDTEHEIPHYMDVEINGINGDIKTLQINRKSARVIEMLELDELVSEIEFKYDFDKEKSVLAVEDVSFKVDDLAKLSFEVDLHGVKSLSNLAMQFMRAPQSIKVSSGALEYENYSDRELITSSMAVDDGLSYEDARAKILKESSKFMEKAEKAEDDVEYELAEMMHDFFENPKSFEISVSPAEPVTFREIGKAKNSKEAKALLGFEVEVN